MKQKIKIMNIKDIFKKTEEKVSQILCKEPIKNVKKIPSKQGIYLIYHNKKVIYTGKSNNLNRRIRSHLSAGLNTDSDIFRKKINRVHEISPGQEMKKWVSNNCVFAYEEIEDEDLRSLAEVLLIVSLRKRGTELLND